MAPSPPPIPGLPISGHTALAGVLGDPVRHSLSPAMHNAALRALGLDWVYLALPVPAAGLETVLAGLAFLGCRGLNVTLPHKQAAWVLAAERCPLAERLGAVNTLVPRPAGGWFGTNTDVAGFLAPLRAEDRDWRAERAVVLGTGGSARAVLAGLLELGLERITLVGRRPDGLAELLELGRCWSSSGGQGRPDGLNGLLWPEATAGRSGSRDDLSTLLAGCGLLVNTTPVGMASAHDPDAVQRNPLTADQADQLPSSATVYDLIYTPRPTALLRRAALGGCRSLDGLDMLVEQGAASLRLWSGLADVPLALMREAALAQLSPSA